MECPVLVRYWDQDIDLNWLWTNRRSNKLHDIYTREFFSHNLPLDFKQRCSCNTMCKIINIRRYIKKIKNINKK